MQHQFHIGDPVRRSGGQGPELRIDRLLAPTHLFAHYLAAPRYVCTAQSPEGPHYFVYTERELEAVAQTWDPGACVPEPAPLFI